ncbi:MAG: hypothetical protein U9R66_06910 [Thermodesulfobacteriota bacterium]|nr:hypothetical protein [Thermodesulfobacteriota bacterium]
MAMTVYNPQKGRLETIDAVMTDKNTTWFDNCEDDQDISMITDFEGGILISEFGYGHPVLICEVTSAEIGYDQKKAKKLKD